MEKEKSFTIVQCFQLHLFSSTCTETGSIFNGTLVNSLCILTLTAYYIQLLFWGGEDFFLYSIFPMSHFNILCFCFVIFLQY